MTYARDLIFYTTCYSSLPIIAVKPTLIVNWSTIVMIIYIIPLIGAKIYQRRIVQLSVDKSYCA